MAGAFQQGMALGQSAVNAALDIKMQKVRDQRIREQLVIENSVREQKMQAELKSKAALAEITTTLRDAAQKPGGIVNDDIVGAMTKASASLLPQDADTLYKVASLYDQTESRKLAAEERVRRAAADTSYTRLFSPEKPRTRMATLTGQRCTIRCGMTNLPRSI
jgi:hypothetical protein